MTKATVQVVDNDLVGKRVRLLPGKSVPLGDGYLIGKEAVVKLAQVITTIHNVAVLDFELMFDDGKIHHYGKERFVVVD